MYYYKPLWGLEAIPAVIIWSSLTVSHVIWAFVYYYFFYNTIIDLVSLSVTSLLCVQNWWYFYKVITNLQDKEARKKYYNSARWVALGPWFIWPITWLAYWIHSIVKIYSYSAYSYIAVKQFLFFIYNLSLAFVGFECMFPIYEWYWLLY